MPQWLKHAAALLLVTTQQSLNDACMVFILLLVYGWIDGCPSGTPPVVGDHDTFIITFTFQLNS